MTGPRVVTLSSLYGTGDDAIGRRVADRMGVEFVDREIPALVADRLGLPETAVAAYDEQTQSTLDRLIDAVARAPVLSQALPPERLEISERRYKAQVERLLGRTAASGGVILGRAGAVVLGSAAGALHVRLVGNHEARVQRTMAEQGIDEQAAERLVHDNDRARAEYGHRLYGVDPAELRLYHLVIDTTAFDIDTCVELITLASDARARATESSPS